MEGKDTIIANMNPDGSGPSVVDYTQTLKNWDPESFRAALDPHHNFHVLVDHGIDMYGGEITFRTALERKLAESVKGSHANATVVLVVVQGGPNTITTARNAIRNHTPIVAIGGTGQAADLLSDAWNFLHNTRYIY